MARRALARSPAAMPWAAGPVTFAAVMVPVNVAELPAGQAGWPPPPHRKIMTPAATRNWPKWMCDTSGLPERFLKVSVKVMLVMLPSSWMTALNVPVPSLLIGGTSLRPRRLAVRTVTSLSEATVATLKQRTIKTNARNASFFMLESLLPTGNLRKLASAGNPKRHLKKIGHGKTPRQRATLVLTLFKNQINHLAFQQRRVSAVDLESFYCMGAGNWSMLPVGSRSHPGLATDPVGVLTENNHTFKELLALPERAAGAQIRPNWRQCKT